MFPRQMIQMEKALVSLTSIDAPFPISEKNLSHGRLDAVYLFSLLSRLQLYLSALHSMTAPQLRCLRIGIFVFEINALHQVAAAFSWQHSDDSATAFGVPFFLGLSFLCQVAKWAGKQGREWERRWNDRLQIHEIRFIFAVVDSLLFVWRLLHRNTHSRRRLLVRHQQFIEAYVQSFYCVRSCVQVCGLGRTGARRCSPPLLSSSSSFVGHCFRYERCSAQFDFVSVSVGRKCRTRLGVDNYITTTTIAILLFGARMWMRDTIRCRTRAPNKGRRKVEEGEREKNRRKNQK